MSSRIHIVSFDIPFPADYGGVIDVFSRVKWLAENGFNVVLHCFEYHRPKAKELNKYAEVHYYPRPKGLKYWLSKTPFIVNTRINSELEKILRETKDEVLLEGLHCAHYLNLQPGKFFLRTHNIEHEYYQKLSKNVSLLKRLYYRSEAKKLKKYEPILAKAKGLLVISKNELDHFKSINENSFVVPSLTNFIPQYQETEPYVLFHGNLSVEENEEAASWIVDHVASKLKTVNFKIAGKNPSTILVQKCDKASVQLISNPSEIEMKELVQKARIHLLWTSNSSGLKLKFIHALSSSGHVVCNRLMTVGSEIDKGFHLFSSPEEARELIQKHHEVLLTREDFEMRREAFNATSGVQKLKEIFEV